MFENCENKKKLSVIVFLVLTSLFLTACQSPSKVTLLNNSHGHESHALKGIIPTTFGPDGTLWRLFPTEKNIFVEYSTDLGRSFSQPFKVNPDEQKMNIWAENPPIIISEQRLILVILMIREEPLVLPF